MSDKEYIWLDLDGKELKREPKGRGRQRKGSIEREPGKFYITVGEVVKTKSAPAPVEEETEEVVTEEVVTDEFGQTIPQRKKTKTKVSKEKMAIENFASNCKPMSYSCEKGYLHILDRVIITGQKMEYPDIMFNSVFVKITLNDKDKSITLYTTDREHPSLILSGALI